MKIGQGGFNWEKWKQTGWKNPNEAMRWRDACWFDPVEAIKWSKERRLKI